MTLELHPLTADDLRPAWHTLERAFGAVPAPADEDVELGLVDPARFYGVRDGSELIATGGSFDLLMTVPGGRLPVAGVTWVGVLPTHRRRGVLTSLMDRQLRDLHGEGRAVAALWASQSAIYGRFGYGVAAWDLAVTVPSGAPFREPVAPGHVRFADPTAEALGPVHDAFAARTAGCFARDAAWWDNRLHDPEHRRSGAGPQQCVVTEDGYALYATTSTFEAGLPTGTVRVKELIATTPLARARLWRHLLDVDLMQEVDVPRMAVDDPLVLDLLTEPRAARPALRDSLHVRLVDVPAALTGRRYACEVDVVLQVEDPQCPWNTGTWRLEGDRSGASCVPTRSAPDLVLGPADLGAAYLGGTPLRSRAVGERRPGALALTSTAFGPLEGAPWCPMTF